MDRAATSELLYTQPLNCDPAGYTTLHYYLPPSHDVVVVAINSPDLSQPLLLAALPVVLSSRAPSLGVSSPDPFDSLALQIAGRGKEP